MIRNIICVLGCSVFSMFPSHQPPFWQLVKKLMGSQRQAVEAWEGPLLSEEGVVVGEVLSAE